MNTLQTSKMTGIPVEILVRMRDRNTRSLKSGPPFHKMMGKSGEAIYAYKATEVRAWMRIKLCQITAGDAASIIGWAREDILNIHGIQAFRIQREGFNGRLIINNSNNIYVWLPTKNNRRKLSI